MNTLKRIGTLVLLAVFLFGITGLSIFRHTCSSSNNDTRSFYAGIFTTAPGNCCGEEETGPQRPASGDQPLALDETACCKSTTSFLALKVITERQEKLVIRHENVITDHPLTIETSVSVPERPFVPVEFRRFHSPPLAGKQLVHFLHQIKIPAHPDLA